MGGSVSKGQNVVLPASVGQVQVRLNFRTPENSELDLDVVALLLGRDRRVRNDQDMVFYNQPSSADGSVVLTGKSVDDGSGSDSAVIDLEALSPEIDCVAVVATVDGGGFDDLHHLEVELLDGPDPVVTYTAADLTTERAVLLAEVYRRGDDWKFRAVGQGWDSGLAGLATDFGISVDDSEQPDAELGDAHLDTEAVLDTDTVLDFEGAADPVTSPEDGTAVGGGVSAVEAPQSEPDDQAITPPRRRARPTKVRVRSQNRRIEAPTPQLALDPGWQPSRLFSVAAIGGQDEQEKRATSALMWTLGAVPQLSRSLTARAGAPAGAVETYLEVPFTLGERKVIPDAVIRVARGKRSWTGLVEVKTGAGVLRKEQLEGYLAVAKRKGFDAVITISNDVSIDPAVLPVEFTARAMGKVKLVHLSWAEIMHELRMLLAHHDLADPLAVWVISELLRYLEHPRSGAVAFQDMGPHWVAAREALAAGTLVAGDKQTRAVVESWFKLCRQLGFSLTARLGVPVRQIVARKYTTEPDLRLGETATCLALEGCLRTTFKVPGAAGPISVEADIRTGKVHVAIEVEAPGEGTPVRRVSWLTKQLASASDKTVIETHCVGNDPTRNRLSDLRASAAAALPDKAAVPQRFRLTLQSPLGPKRSGPKGGFVESVTAALDSFYVDVVEVIRPWTPPAPQLEGEIEVVQEDEDLDTGV